MLVVFLLFLACVSAQDYDSPTYLSLNCADTKKSQKCNTFFEFTFDSYTSQPIKWPVRCSDNPASNRYCMATPIQPSTPTSGFCRPRCATNQKRQTYTISKLCKSDG